ncbi:MAG: glycerophosphodiester phosphodiesterase family protein [Chthoniobacterales bacterium]
MTPLVIAHRGASHDAPENTMAAFRLAWEQGADGIETDLHLTADDRIVAIHDANGRRTLGDARVIRNLKFDELRTMDAGRWKHRRWTGERVPSLREILDELPPLGQLVLELKENLTDALATELSEASHDRITLIAFDPATIAEAKRKMPACRTLWLFKDYASVPEKQRGAFLAGRVRELGIDGVDLRHERRMTAELLRPLREDGRIIFTYTINRGGGAQRCAELGLDGITTDKPAEARRWLGISA